MLRQNRDTVEDAFPDRIRFGHLHENRLVVLLAYVNRLAADEEQVPLRRVDRFVEIHIERKHHVICRAWMTVGEFQIRPQLDRVVEAIFRNRPRRGERRLGLERLPVDVDEIREQRIEHGVGLRVSRQNGIEGAGRRSLGHNDLASPRRSGGFGAALLRGGPETHDKAQGGAACAHH